MSRVLISLRFVFLLLASNYVVAAPPRNLMESSTINGTLGVNVHSLEQSPAELTLLHDAGLFTLRTDFSWSDTEKQKGVYDFSAQEKCLKSLDAAGLRAMWMFGYSNPIYGDDGKPPYTAAGRAAFARWATAAVHHFAGRGVIWEIWNEPNGKWFWPNPDAKAYSALALTVGEAIRNDSPREIIVGPALYGADDSFLDVCCKNGCLKVFDAITYHPYRSSDIESSGDDDRKLRAIISRYSAGKAIPLLQGECGLQTKGEYAQRDRAMFLVRMFLSDVMNRVPLSIWYDWVDDNESMGLIRFAKEGDPTSATPEAGYNAAKRLSDTFGEFRFDVDLLAGANGTDFALQFRDANRRKRFAVWSRSDKPHEITFPAGDGNFDVIASLGERPTFILKSRGGRLTVNASDVPVYIVPTEIHR